MTSYVLCKIVSLVVFKVTARDQGHYKGPSGAFVTYCNISCFFYLILIYVKMFVTMKRTTDLKVGHVGSETVIWSDLRKTSGHNVDLICLKLCQNVRAPDETGY